MTQEQTTIIDPAQQPQSGNGSDSTHLLACMREAAVELAEYASYAEIAGAINHNRQPIRQWCDRVFELNRLLDDAG